MYDNAVALFARGELDWENDEIRMILATDRYQPSQTGDLTRDDLREHEVAATGTYQKGGMLLRQRTVSRGVPNEVRLHGGMVTWYGFTGEFRYAVLVQARGGEDRLIAYADLGNQQATNARVSVEYDPTEGVAAFTVAPAMT
jgi:hypothetical protein